jgi:hypothetical protein
MFGGRQSNIIVAIAAAGFAAFYAMWLLDFAIVRVGWCAGGQSMNSCAREWIGATSGWAAAIFAAGTIYFLWKQVDQVVESRRDQARGIADTLLIDLLDTATRLPAITQLHDLEPRISELSRSMIREATNVAPELAIALQQHCREVGSFESVIRARTAAFPGTIPPALLKQANALAFRAKVLSWCFGVASAKISAHGRATGPYIDKSDLSKLESEKGVGPQEWVYLAYLFETSGIGEK